MTDPKPLTQFVAEAIDEALLLAQQTMAPLPSGAEVYWRAFERFERAGFERDLSQKQRFLEKELPMLAAARAENWTVE